MVLKGYKLQIGSHPPKLNGVLPTVVGLEQARVMEQEVQGLMVKEAVEQIPHGMWDVFNLIKFLGLRLNVKKNIFTPVKKKKKTFWVVIWYSLTVKAQLTAYIESILAKVTRIKLGQYITAKQF